MGSLEALYLNLVPGRYVPWSGGAYNTILIDNDMPNFLTRINKGPHNIPVTLLDKGGNWKITSRRSDNLIDFKDQPLYR